MFDIFGDGILNSDNELWEIHRKTTMFLLKHADFQTLLEKTIVNKVENGLLPILESVSMRNQEIDLQEIFQRFAFDVICLLLLDYDPQSLSLQLPFIPCEKAFTDAEEAILWRHVLPEKVWKLQKRFGLGKEKKMIEATKAFDEFIYKCMSNKHDEAIGMVHDNETGLLTSLLRGFEGMNRIPRDMRKFLRDTVLSLMIAGRDTTSMALSWFFYLLAQNPCVESKIRDEIGEKWGVKEVDKLIYLHGGICEALRLYPPVALEHKAPLKAGVLPSRHVIDANTKIILCFYSMGRMEDIWGEDCMVFKPERWFTKDGGIKHEPSYKFTAFHAGPRTCLGKEMGLIQIKMVAASIICLYRVELVEGHKTVVLEDIRINEAGEFLDGERMLVKTPLQPIFNTNTKLNPLQIRGKKL
uniref:Alkane hydroxylase MAH1-like n=1 Tax=Tanacetum cinerariifolium TaxID=118510 RepID=A0A699I233_TANCI|nr:alkane hydroxylase MAH1-like [Tanacetum cinerariifolium]